MKFGLELLNPKYIKKSNGLICKKFCFKILCAQSSSQGWLKLGPKDVGWKRGGAILTLWVSVAPPPFSSCPRVFGPEAFPNLEGTKNKKV